MSLLDIMPIDQAIEFYYKKHHAIREGNLEKLINIKKECPEIFDKKTDEALRTIIEYAKEFEQSMHYKSLQKAALKEQLSVLEPGSSDQ